MIKTLLRGVATTAAVLFAPQPLLAQSGVEPARIERDLVYRQLGETALRADVYRAAGSTPAPVLVHFHGGGWARGARPRSWTGFRAYLAAGISVVTVQYRLAGDAPAPAAVEDARCALQWVATNAGRFGFDPERIIVGGTSAGAHLALMAGLLPADNPIDPADCRAVPRAAAILDFYGPTDLGALSAKEDSLHPTVARWIGPRPDADTMARTVSPVQWIGPESPPIFIAHGDADAVVPVAQSQALAEQLRGKGRGFDLFIVPGGGHGNFAVDQRAAMMARLLRFLCNASVVRGKACGDEI